MKGLIAMETLTAIFKNTSHYISTVLMLDNILI